jgi:putative DNA primase/helicase
MTPADYLKLGWKLIPLHHARPDGMCTCGHTQGANSACECGDPKCKVKHGPGSIAKHPREKNWPSQASGDLEVVSGWPRRWPGCNLGIATGAASGVVVIDVDPKNGGDVSLKRFMAEHGRFPSTPLQRTPSGGWHFVFRAPTHPVSNAPLGRDYPGIDIRADGGQIVAAPSRTPVGAYSWRLSPTDTPLADLPSAVLERLQRGPARSVTPVGAPDTARGYFPPAPPAVLEAARSALERHGAAIDGQAGGLHTVHAGMLLTHDFALTDEEALPLLLQWNETCVPPWETDELRAKALGNGRRYGKNPYGSKRTMDALETARKLIADWQTNPGPDGQVSMFDMLNRVRDLRFTDPAKRALVLRELKASTGIGVRELALPAAVDVEAQAEQAKRREDYSKSPKSNVVDTSEPLDTARRFLSAGRDSEGLPELVRWQGEFWRAEGTHYTARADELVSADLYRFLDGKRDVSTGAPVKPDRTMVEVLAHALRAAAALDVAAPPAWVNVGEGDAPAEEMISFRNGLLHTPTRSFQPPSRRLFTLNALAFDYTPRAPRPAEWMRFLQQLWGSDMESLETLQELMGLLLTGDTSHQKIFLLVGPRRSGKGTVGRLLQALVGEANYCAPTLGGLAKDFGLEALVGKTLAVISDARLSGKADQSAVVENLLRISGEDVVSAPRKYKTDWTSKLRTRFVILSNEVPALMDQSGALASRFVVLQLRHSFYGQEDRGLEGKLLAELPGILLWALEGLDRLRARGYFRQPGSGTEAVRQLEALASPVKAFIEDRCELTPEGLTDSATLYGAWSSWCLEQGRPPGTAPIFGRNLLSAYPELRVSRPRAGDKRVRVYEGLRVVST